MTLESNSWRSRIAGFFATDKPLYILLLVVLLERLIYVYAFGNSGMTVSDSWGYYDSGIQFAKTGRITYLGYTTALIMPGITVLIGLLAMVFEEGEALLGAISFVWIIFGTLTPYFMYKAANVFLPKHFSLLAVIPYLLPSYVGISCHLLTEGPFYMFFAMAMYYLFKVGKDGKTRDTVLFGIAVLGAMLFRANVLMFAGFALVYLMILKKYSWRELAKKTAVVAAILMLFILPWTIRNFHHFNDFIPVTYGMGNPVFEGTYFGDLCPVDDKIDMSVPQAMFKEEYAHYYDEKGEIRNPDLTQYLLHMETGIAADYRISQWLKLDPQNFLSTYLLVKPRLILNWAWYYDEIMGIGYGLIHSLRLINCLMCAAAIPLCLITKKLRKQTLFLGAAYGISLLSVAYALPIDRYAETIMPYRFLMACFAVYMAWELWKTMTKKLRKE